MDAPPSLIVAIAMSRHRQNKTPVWDILAEFTESADYYHCLAKEYENAIKRIKGSSDETVTENYSQ
jgi:hypothetical protein